MTRIMTSRVVEALELQIASIRDYAAELATADLEVLEEALCRLEGSTRGLREMLEALPHRHSDGEGAPELSASPDTGKPGRVSSAAGISSESQRPH